MPDLGFPSGADLEEIGNYAGRTGHGGNRAKYLMRGADDFSESARCDGACR